MPDAFVTILNAFGNGLLYSTYLGGYGGTGWDYGHGIAVDGSRNVYITGGTCSTDFPTTPDLYQGRYGGGYYDAFVVKLGPTNRPPEFAIIGDKTVNEGELLELTVTATDPDGDALTYSASNLPTGATFDPATQKFSWIPDYTQAGNYSGIRFLVTDGITVDSEEITIIVNDVAPIRLLGELIDYIKSLKLPKGIEQSLTSKLENAIKSMEKGQENAAINQINAFINEVGAQRGKKLTFAQADDLVKKAKCIIDVINL